MSEPWPVWAGGGALAGVALGHWLLTGRLMAISGRFTRLVDGLRFGRSELQEAAPVPEDELLALLRAATAAEFGDVEAEAAAAPASVEDCLLPPPGQPQSASAQPWWFHLAFLAALVAGGAASAALAGPLQAEFAIRGEGFKSVFGSGPAALLPLLIGGVLVGAGTRMAGGCTSGHGLCGVSRLQRGSLLATAAFFGAGIVTSLALGALSK